MQRYKQIEASSKIKVISTKLALSVRPVAARSAAHQRIIFKGEKRDLSLFNSIFERGGASSIYVQPTKQKQSLVFSRQYRK